NGIHDYDLEKYGDALFTCIGSSDINVLLYTRTDGNTWEKLNKNVMQQYRDLGGSYNYTLFTLDNKLYALSSIRNASFIKMSYLICIEQVNGEFSASLVDGSKMIANPLGSDNYIIKKRVQYQDKLIYITSSYIQNEPERI